MNAFRVLAALALACWAAALWPGAAPRGRDWVLVDRSASLGGDPEPAEVWQAAGRDRAWWDSLVRRGRVRRAPAPGREAEGTPLGAALAALRPELRAGDRVLAWTDGRVTDALPAAEDFPAQLRWLRPAARPRLVDAQVPARFDPDQDLVAVLHVVDGDVRRGAVSLRATPGAARIVASEPRAAGELALRLRVESAASEAVRVDFRYVEEGVASTRTAVTRPATGGAPPLFDAAGATHAATLEDWRARLQRGEVLVLASADADAWGALPADLRVFRLDPDAAGEGPAVLLDVSGSMDGGALEAARAFLLRVAASTPAGAAPRVHPFRGSLLPPLDPSSAAGRAQLQELVAHGPTGLAAALDALADEGLAARALILVSDGQVEAPPGGWAALAARLPRDVRVWAVPVGPDAAHDALAEVGEVVAGEDLLERLRTALRAAWPERSGTATAVDGATLPVPRRWEGLGPRPPLRSAGGAETLMRGAAGEAVVAARRVGGGLLLGVAAAPEAVAVERLGATARAHRDAETIAWDAEGLWLRTAGAVPVLRQDGRRLDVALADHGDGALWHAPRAQAHRPVTVLAGEGGAWTLPPRGDRESATTTARWAAWLESLRNRRTGATLRPTLLGCGLLLLTIALFARRRTPS